MGLKAVAISIQVHLQNGGKNWGGVFACRLILPSKAVFPRHLESVLIWLLIWFRERRRLDPTFFFARR